MTKQKKIIIEGITKDGQTFRPSDWAERMSGKLASYQNRRLKYSPMLQPKRHKEGYKCVLLDPALKQSNPALYESIMNFAKTNNLVICDEEDNDKVNEDE